MTVPRIQLHDGTSIPQLGFGVFRIDPADTAEAETPRPPGRLPPHRHRRDVRQREGVGEAPRPPGLARDDVYVTSTLQQRLPTSPPRPGAPSRRTLTRPRPRPHRPVPHPLAAADALRRRLRLDLAHDGRPSSRTAGPRSVGVSNFPARPPESGSSTETWRRAGYNQVEVHPYFTNEAVRAANAEHGVATEAWIRSIAKGTVRRAGSPEIAEAKGGSSAQVTLRWHVERGDVVFPKSVNPVRLRRRTSKILRFLAHRRRGGASPGSTVARTAAPARTPTRSTTSPTDRDAPHAPPAVRRPDPVPGRAFVVAQSPASLTERVAGPRVVAEEHRPARAADVLVGERLLGHQQQPAPLPARPARLRAPVPRHRCPGRARTTVRRSVGGDRVDVRRLGAVDHARWPHDAQSLKLSHHVPGRPMIGTRPSASCSDPTRQAVTLRSTQVSRWLTAIHPLSTLRKSHACSIHLRSGARPTAARSRPAERSAPGNVPRQHALCDLVRHLVPLRQADGDRGDVGERL